MSEFFVGQKVVCVDDAPLPGFVFRGIEKGGIYTIRWVGLFAALSSGIDELCLRFEGVVRHNRIRGVEDVPALARRFRPLESKATQLFRAIAQGVTDRKPIVPDDYRIPGTEIPITEELVRSLWGNGRPML